MNHNAVYIIPHYPIYNRLAENNFENFSDEDLSFLKSTLYLNLLENVNSKKDKVDIFRIFDSQDEDLLSSELNYESNSTIFSNVTDLTILFNELLIKKFSAYKNNIIIFSNSVNVRPQDLDKYFNLLNIDDNALVISKSSSDIIQVFGFNFFTDELFNYLIDSSLSLEKFLSFNKSCDYFVNTLGDVFSVTSIDDFKKLYVELSQKRSNEYCSQQIHERFTHLFIEYKDLLK